LLWQIKLRERCLSKCIAWWINSNRSARICLSRLNCTRNRQLILWETRNAVGCNIFPIMSSVRRRSCTFGVSMVISWASFIQSILATIHIDVEITEGLLELPEFAQDINAGGEATSQERIVTSIEKVRGTIPDGAFFDRLKNIRYKYLEIANLSGQIQAELRNRKVPEPILVLSNESIIFFGEHRELTELNENQMACLWILAERPGLRVTRADIRKARKIKTAEEHMKSTISRLRTILRRMADAYCVRTHNPKPNGYKNGFILGGRGPRSDRQRYSGCPYMLDLDPLQVKLSGARPDWMEPSPST
jgi:hypothetical protein